MQRNEAGQYICQVCGEPMPNDAFGARCGDCWADAQGSGEPGPQRGVLRYSMTPRPGSRLLAVSGGAAMWERT